MANGIFNGFAQRLLASAVCAFAFVSGGVQAAPTLISASPGEISAGNFPAGIFVLTPVEIDVAGTFDIRWSVRFLTSGGLSAAINRSPQGGGAQTTAGLFSSNVDNELGSLVVAIPTDGGSGHSLDWTYLNAGYYLLQIEGITSIASQAFGGQGIFRVQDPPAPVPLPATVALLGLGLVGIGAARRKQA